LHSNLRKLCFLTFLILTGALNSHAATYTASSCSQSDVQEKFTAEQASPANGDVIVIPACPGGVTWATGITSFNTSVSLTIQGSTTVSGSCYPTACTATDNTVITCDASNGCGGALNITLTGGSSQEVRITGLTIIGTAYNGNIIANGAASVSGPQFRIDHNHFSGYTTTAIREGNPAYGVADHNVFDASGSGNGIQVWSSTSNNGDNAFAASTAFGSANFFFIENNTFNNGYVNDCNVGGRYVFRYNVFITSGPGSVQSHATGSAPPYRGCRAWEVYQNVFSGSSNGSFATSFQTSGTGLQWGNEITGFPHDISLVEDRDGNFTYPQSAPPNGWGYCGTTQTGSASSWDGNVNSNGSNGWPCLDQIGRGKSDLLSGVFPSRSDTLVPALLTGMWPHQASEPVYIWDETFNGSMSLVSVYSPNNNIQANRDYYAPVNPFTGSGGTGTGTLASRPSVCTAMVAYWAIDQNVLYQCQAGNVWIAYYTPYVYPHPLVSGSQTSDLPAAPTNLTAAIQ